MPVANGIFYDFDLDGWWLLQKVGEKAIYD